MSAAGPPRAPQCPMRRSAKCEGTRVRATYGWSGLGAALLAALVGGCSSPSPSAPSIKVGDDSAEITGFGYLAPGVHQATANLKSKSNSPTYGLITFYEKNGRVTV